jgi:hypothetical protein
LLAMPIETKQLRERRAKIVAAAKLGEAADVICRDGVAAAHGGHVEGGGLTGARFTDAAAGSGAQGASRKIARFPKSAAITGARRGS